ncbi:hypothetical protein [Jiangella asiatica]|uniref:DUF8094 domain-containing protein n=1 Tax=Jiangella asiatica TaxID=2530372 RepID=A0A4R5D3S8_9ACTN|nr:hypothetical protein [Jiangella asiatica]TDE08039.1 hypothetical protein E1269_19105 [Jiangella asiatica]
MRRPGLRTVLGVALIVLGTPPLLAGGAAAVYVGPDDTVELVRRDVATDSPVIATAVDLASVTGPVLHVSADAGDIETFVGLAHRIHVDSYLEGVAQQTITDLTPRGEITIADSTPDDSGGADDEPGSGQETEPGPGLETEPTPGFETEPGAGFETESVSRSGTEPGQGLETEPGSGLETEPGSGLETEPGPGFETDPGTGSENDEDLGAEDDPGTGLGTGAGPAAAPGDLDWWQESASGAGRQAVAFELTDEPLRVVVTTPSAAAALDVSFGIDAEIDGLFLTAILVGVAGLLLVAGGVLVLWLRRRRRKRALTVVSSPEPADKDEDEDKADDADRPTPPDGDGDGAKPADGEPEPEKIATVTPLPKRPLPKRTPPPPAPPPPPKPTARVAVVLGLSLSGLVTACAQVPEEITEADRASTIPAITADRAAEFFTLYSETSAEAASTLDGTLLAEVAGGTLLETTQFAFEQQLTTGTAEPGVPAEPAAVVPGTVLSPQVDAYPMWAVVTGEPADGAAPPWYLLTREDAASPWLASIAVQPTAQTSITAPVTSDDGDAVVADEDTVTRGLEALDALVEYGETGVEPERIDLTNADGVTRLPQHGLQLDTAPPEFGSVSRTCAVESPDDIHWLTTEYGAVALATISCTQTMSANPGFSVVIEADGLGTIPGGSEIVQSQISQSASFILSVDADGSATVTGQGMQPLAMTWSLP